MAIPRIQNLKENPHHEDKIGSDIKTLVRITYARKTSTTLAAGADEEEDEQADMAYMAGSTSLP